MRAAVSIFVLICAPALLAQAADVTRVLKTFDFEERRLGNEEELPMNWVKVHGPGLPHYVNGRLTADRHRSGGHSFRFDLNGGGLIYRYGPGQIKVQRWAHYRIEGWCQTTVLPNARARITAYFADIDGRALRETARHSDLYAARSDDEPWTQLSVDLSADSPRADSLVIELELLQPMHYAVSKLAERALFDQDIRGSAWWDDVTVSQVPQVALRTDRPGNVFRRDELPRISALIRDRFTDDLTAQLSVRDADGKEVYQRTGTPDVTSGGEQDGQRGRMSLELPPLPPGYYEASLAMSSQGKPLTSQTLHFVVLADGGNSPPPDPRFGFVATDLPFDSWNQLPRVLPMFSAARVKLAVWSERGGVEASGEAVFDRLLARFQERGITPTACLLDPPPALADKLSGPGWLPLLKASAQDWQPELAYLVSRHANHLERWQLGADGSDAFVADSRMRDVYRMVYQQFARLMEKPELAMPWSAWYELPPDLPASAALNVPTAILPSQLPLYLKDLGGHRERDVSLTLQLLDRSRYGRDVQLRDLAQRVVFSLAAGAERIDLPLPLSVSRDEEGITLQPDELFAVVRTLLATLSGAQFIGKVALADGIEAFLFDRGGQGILALWDRGDRAGVKDLAVNLGERPVSIDLWGDVSPLLRRPGDRAGRVALRVGPMPMFLVGIDAQQAQLRASVAIDRPLLESSFRPHERRIRFVNPYKQAITGVLKLSGPSGWTFNPPTFNFSLNPGDTFERPVTIQFPYNSFAGPKNLACDFHIEGEQDADFTVPLTMRLGLTDVGMQTVALRVGRDLVVQQMITNYGDKPINYTAFALCPGQARQERLVTELQPGATTIKRFRFTNLEVSKPATVRVGLKELEGARILNDQIDVR